MEGTAYLSFVVVFSKAQFRHDKEENIAEKFSHGGFKVFLVPCGILSCGLFGGEHWENAFGDFVIVLITKKRMDV